MSGFGSASARPDYSTGFRAKSTKTRTSPAAEWRTYPGHLDQIIERLRGVVIENLPAIDCVKRFDGVDTLHYVDPPYVASSRHRGATVYAHEMSDEDHEDLADCLHSVEGSVVLSGYRTELYDTLYQDWKRIDRNALADGAAPRIESLWFNSAAQESGQQSLAL